MSSDSQSPSSGLRDRGNTVIVVEHDETMIRRADHVIEIGPAAGIEGGRITFEGTPEQMLDDDQCLTGQFLTGQRGWTLRERTPRRPRGFLSLKGASGHNLRNIDVEFPLGVLCLVTGISGSGKSSLVQDTLYGAIRQRKSGEACRPLPFDGITGLSQIEDCMLVDQSPISRSPRSAPVTFVKAFDPIRKVFAETVDARTRNFGPGHFSFNSAKGQCKQCEGAGSLQIDMQFLADISMQCPACRGTRFRDEILGVRYRDRHIAEVLEMSVREAMSFFRGCDKVQDRLQRMIDVGLDYIKLGQPATTLSSGEGQRLKLAAFLASASRKRTLFILDEPTTGLHFADIVRLVDCFDALLADGHGLIVVEHNPMLMQAADHLIDLGPGAAERADRWWPAERHQKSPNPPRAEPGRCCENCVSWKRPGDPIDADLMRQLCRAIAFRLNYYGPTSPASDVSHVSLPDGPPTAGAAVIPRFPSPPLRPALALGCACALAASVQAQQQGTEAAKIAFFESSVRPLLIEHCYECHSEESGESSGDFLIDSAAGIHKGGSHGRALVPGNVDDSLIIRAVRYEDSELQMPPEGKLDAQLIAVLEKWVEIGAPDPREGNLKAVESPLDRDPRSHWAFNAPKRTIPKPVRSVTARDVIDFHAERRATGAGLRLNEEADREVLIRRLYFDLTGLAPSQDAIESFQTSKRPTEYARLVDELLSTPQFGERFGRHWLDVARYADTVGYALAGRERRYKGSNQYRDWVIKSFVEDMPYDEMIHHQISADRTDPENKQGNLDAMGFLTLGRKFLNPLDVIDDRIDVITRGLLGMTVTCARCHDHKFDPIPSSDYYSLGGIIFSSQQPKDGASPLMMVDKETPIDSPVLIRGQLGNHGPIAPRQFLAALRQPDEPRFTDGSGRWELAQRITAADNPLTARVMVNRIWSQLIGRPLVTTPSDFGFRTEPPAVPEVLDDLAADFSDHWSIKRLVRRIVMTRIYRQTSSASPDAIVRDPDNSLLARGNRKRRDFESLRDSMLQAASMIDHTMGGEPVEITLANVTPRRTVYAMVDRQNLPSLFRTFDFASPDAHAPKRYTTTVPNRHCFCSTAPRSISSPGTRPPRYVVAATVMRRKHSLRRCSHACCPVRHRWKS